MNNTEKIILVIGVLLVTALGVVMWKAGGISAVTKYFEKNKEGVLDGALMRTADKLNKNLPIMVDSETRLDSTVGINRQFRYNYTLVNYAAEELDPAAIKNGMQPKLINNFCSNDDMKFFVENKVPLTYAYFGKNGKQITIITISADQCK